MSRYLSVDHYRVSWPAWLRGGVHDLWCCDLAMRGGAVGTFSPQRDWCAAQESFDLERDIRIEVGRHGHGIDPAPNTEIEDRRVQAPDQFGFFVADRSV